MWLAGAPGRGLGTRLQRAWGNFMSRGHLVYQGGGAQSTDGSVLKPSPSAPSCSLGTASTFCTPPHFCFARGSRGA